MFDIYFFLCMLVVNYQSGKGEGRGVVHTNFIMISIHLEEGHHRSDSTFKSEDMLYKKMYSLKIGFRIVLPTFIYPSIKSVH